MKVCGQLEKAQLEHLSSDPSGDNLYSGRVWYNSTSDNLKCYDGTSIKELSPSINAIVVDYIIPDASGYSFIEVTDTTATRTVTLPTVADNKGRIIEVINTSTQKGKVIVDGEGSETINGFLTIELDCKYSRIKIISTGSQWIVLDSFFNDKEYTLTVTGSGWTNVRSTGVPYRGLDGVWKLRAAISGTHAGTTSLDITITDTVFPYEEAVAVCGKAAGGAGFTRSANGTININSTTSATEWTVHVDCQVNKPAFLE